MTTNSRRDFFKKAGLGAAASMAVTGGWLKTEIARAEDAVGKEAKFQLGMASYTLRSFSQEEAIAMTKRLELEQICFKSFHLAMDSTDEECAAAAAACREAGMELYGGGVISMKSEEDVNNAFRYAKAAGMSVIVGTPSPEMLPLVDVKIKETDIRVAIHNHGPGDNVYPRPQDAYEKTAAFDSRIGLCIDIGHTLRIGADPVESILKYGDRLYDMHLKDVTKAAPDGKTCVCGRGVIDIPGVIRALIEIGYDRIASFEYEAEGSDPLPGAAQSVGYVRGVMDAV